MVLASHFSWRVWSTCGVCVAEHAPFGFAFYHFIFVFSHPASRASFWAVQSICTVRKGSASRVVFSKSHGQNRMPSEFRSFALLSNVYTLITSDCWRNVYCILATVSCWRIACDYVSFGVAIVVHYFRESRSHLSGSFPNNLQFKRTITIILSCTPTCNVN